MKPTNVRPDLLLPDGAPTRCRFYAWGERGRTDDCEANATVVLAAEDQEAFGAWMAAHPKAVIGMVPGWGHLCDVHEAHVRECVAEMGRATEAPYQVRARQVREHMERSREL